MIDAELSIGGVRGRRVQLAHYLDHEAEERAHEKEYDWIKRLRLARFKGGSFRNFFTVRDDSLWWFTELYLHKTQAVLDIFRTVAAIDSLIRQERPDRLDAESAPPLVRHIAHALAARHGIIFGGSPTEMTWLARLARLDGRARLLAWQGLAAADRFRRSPRISGSTDVAAFVHRAFWKGGDEGSAESYIGPVLHELEQRLDPAGIRFIGLGPSTNFRERRRAPVRPQSSAVIPVQQFASMTQLTAARTVWRKRYANYRTVISNPDIRSAATIESVDCWPVIREQLAGVAWLQWPWSVRAMDEAAAALDALAPGVLLTYAEAGGWGRALMLEARRRGIPSVGLQHGFIYRHWLNYLHEEDEMHGGRTPPFPVPTRTLVFDKFAADHLTGRGRFEEAALEVTGSPRLDELVREFSSVSSRAVGEIRRQLNVTDDDACVLVTTKEREARTSLPALVDAASAVSKAVLIIKPHPAETAAAYARIADAHRHVRITSPDTRLAPLLAAARAVATVNSTVALDAGVLDIPALVFGLPNNLSPFVAAGAMAGSLDPAGLPELIRRILYDGEFRHQLAERRRAVFGHAEASRGRAAARSADAILRLMSSRRGSGAAGGR